MARLAAMGGHKPWQSDQASLKARDGWTALKAAAMIGQEEIVALLGAAGATE